MSEVPLHEEVVRSFRFYCFPPRSSTGYRVTSIIRNSASLGPYSRAMPRALWWSYGGEGGFL